MGRRKASDLADICKFLHSVIARLTVCREREDPEAALLYTEAILDWRLVTRIFTTFIRPSVYASLIGLPKHCGRAFRVNFTNQIIYAAYLDNTWKEKVCIECVPESGHCPMRFYRNRRDLITYDVDVCLCHKE